MNKPEYITIKTSEIADEYSACPYCGKEYTDYFRGCCGESSEHGETLYTLENGECYYDHEVIVIDDLPSVEEMIKAIEDKKLSK